MSQHVNGFFNQINSDLHFLLCRDISKEPSHTKDQKDLDIRTTKYAISRVLCSLAMEFTVLHGLLVTRTLPGIAVNVALFVLAHDAFQVLKNREELELKNFSSENIATIAKGIFSGGVTFIKSSWDGKSEDEVARDVAYSTFDKVGNLQSKNTFLKSFWNELQFQLANRGYNPFPFVIKRKS